jgi:hypothetical protein
LVIGRQKRDLEMRAPERRVLTEEEWVARVRKARIQEEFSEVIQRCPAKVIGRLST